MARRIVLTLLWTALAYVVLVVYIMLTGQWMAAELTRHQVPTDSWLSRLFRFQVNYGWLLLLCCVPVLGMLGWLPGTRRK